jgi:N-acyl-D-aspartate/D-glutamate deacylase
MKPRSLKDVPYVALPISEVTNLQTEVVGQDGISYAPVNNRKQMQAIRDQIAGWNGNPTDDECATTLAGIGMFEWSTVGEYLDCLERNRTATNVAMLVPQVCPFLLCWKLLTSRGTCVC